MRHRGPDEPGTWHDTTDAIGAGGSAGGQVVLGFNRLSIIDIAHSHQPLRWGGPDDAPDRYVLVFNGEIYNYVELREELRSEHGAVFHTDGDGEAILAAYHHWGTEALTRLRGMFAFALWDSVEQELFCARDPFGIKPLFMATGPGGTVWAARRSASSRWPTCSVSISPSTSVPSSTTRCCSTCRNPRRCTGESGAWSRAATPGCVPVGGHA